MRRFLKELLPPLVLRYLRRLKHRRYGWIGNYASWEDAKRDAGSYDNEKIIEKVYGALKQVKEGKAVYERDGVLFDKIEYSWPLLSGLMYASSRTQGRLHVLDFGGSLGSTYFQNKKFLDGLKDVSWNVVEQKHFVKTGKKEFQDERLKFYDDIKRCFAIHHPTILVLSSVLQYLEKPYVLLEELLKFDFEFIVIDRTPFACQERLTVQKVPPSIYEASYPCWFFEEKQFLSAFLHRYHVVESFDGLDGKTELCAFRGMILERNND
ncbi:TIGR04325 family methyltransferase [Sulfurospirillum cavolei]|uniref:TIGR04325 family methyltransferase n=1 Tax=Sulfurospirillum cavolei TaxID=366522 RepID=UPI0005AAF01E|nr:TIGR04325 family methyltransferase [Sulfurospirillum cavolei]